MYDNLIAGADRLVDWGRGPSIVDGRVDAAAAAFPPWAARKPRERAEILCQDLMEFLETQNVSVNW
ncbi:MAG: hypothetical protein WBW73_15170 [Rhodoplanes sp.]